jgi:8-oxo-dGTP pyrophosphatase MutT (NUDIX family)
MYNTFYSGAGMIIRDRDLRYLIVRDKRTGKWSFPKGSPEECDNDSPLFTATRECFEETGLSMNSDYTLLRPDPIPFSYNRYYFLASANKNCEYNVRISSREFTEHLWVNISSIEHMWDELNCGVREYVKYTRYECPVY